MPQATRWLRPIITAGTPAYPVPATLREGLRRCTPYQQETAAKAIWGSLASSGLPLRVRDPAIAQLLLPSPSQGSPPAGPTAGSATECRGRAA